MSKIITTEAKAELQAADKEMTRLRKAVGEFEKSLHSIASSIPQSIQPNDPRFAKDFTNLKKLRDNLATLKGSIQGHAKTLARCQSAVQTAEKAIAAELS